MYAKNVFVKRNFETLGAITVHTEMDNQKSEDGTQSKPYQNMEAI